MLYVHVTARNARTGQENRSRPRSLPPFCFLAAWLLLAALTSTVPAAAPPALPESREIPHLIRQLGSSDFSAREAATRTLDSLGESALPALEKAARDSSDPEVRLRAERLRAALWVRLYREVRRFEGHTRPVHCVAFTPDGLRALSGGEDNVVRVWDVKTAMELGVLRGATGAVWSIAVSPDGKQALTAGHEAPLRLWDLSTGREVRRLAGHPEGVLQVAFSRDGTHAISGGHDKTMRWWDVATGRELGRFEGHRGTVYCVALSPDGRHAASGSSDNVVRLWDLKAGKELRQLAGHVNSVWAVAFSPDGLRLLSGSADATLRVWDVGTGKEVNCFRGLTITNRVAFCPGGRWVLSAAGWEGGDAKKPTPLDPSVRLWEVHTGREVHSFVGHTRNVNDVAISADGRYALTASKDGSVRLWRLPR
jgi:WD40 repeat protein